MFLNNLNLIIYSASGHYFSPLIIFKSKSKVKEIWKTYSGATYDISNKGWMNSNVFRHWLEFHFLPEAKSFAPKGYTGTFILFLDGHVSHTSFEVCQFAEKNKICLIRFPSHSTHVLQPCDVAVFGPLKKRWQSKVKSFIRAGNSKVYRWMTRPIHILIIFKLILGNQKWFSKTLREIWEDLKSNPTSFAIKGFAKTGIWPFDNCAITDEQIFVAKHFPWSKNNIQVKFNGEDDIVDELRSVPELQSAIPVERHLFDAVCDVLSKKRKPKPLPKMCKLTKSTFINNSLK